MAPAPTNRTAPVRIARGPLAALQAQITLLREGEIAWADDQRQLYMVEDSGGSLALSPAAASELSNGALLGTYNATTSAIAALAVSALAPPRQGFAVGGKVAAGSGQAVGDYFLVSIAGTPSGDAPAINTPLRANDRITWTGVAWVVIASGAPTGSASIHDAVDVSDGAVTTIPPESVLGVLLRDARVADGLPGAYKLVAWEPSGGGSGVTVSAVAPAGPANGQLWWNSANAELMVWFDSDGSGSGDPGEWLPVASPDAVGEASVFTFGVVRLADAGMVSAGTAGRVVDAAQLKAAIAAATPDASITVKGLARLADATAIAAGVAGRVVDAAQLKAAVTAVTPPDATTAVKGIVQLADSTAITAGTAGRVVDAAQLKAATTAVTAPDATTAVKGIVQLADGTAITAGTAGRVVDAAQLKSAVATAGRVDVGATAPSTPGNGQLWWDPVAQELFIYSGGQWSQTVTPISIGDATSAVAGVVRLADGAAIAAGTANRVVDAAQLKSSISAAVVDATTSVKGVVILADAAAVTAGTSGRIVDAAQLQGAIAASIVDATTASRGVVRLADSAAITVGTVGRIPDAAQLKTATDACLKRNIATLPVLP